MSKLSALQKQLSFRKIDAFVSFNDINISYITDFGASESWFLITPKKSFYITDSRYTEEAKLGLSKLIRVVQHKGSMGSVAFDLCKTHKLKCLGFDDRHISVAQFKQLQKLSRLSGVKLIAVQNLIEDMRIIKTEQEINNIREALKIHRKALAYVKKLLKPGLTEYEVFVKLEQFVRRRGVTFSFDPIIASGANSAFPHASVTDRKLRKNEPVLVDMGVNYNGYMSDLTRMFFLGRMPKPFEEVVEHVAHAQRRAIEYIKAGVRADEVDNQTRNYLKSKGLAKFFGHSLGHGVGREIHESPRLSTHSKTILQENMIITVEPGVYLPNEFGVRLEEMVRVTQDGCEVL